MEIQVFARNSEVPDAVRDYAEKKISRLDRYLPVATRAKIELTLEKTKSAADRAVVQVTLNSNGTPLRAQDRSADFRTSIDAVTQALERQAKRFKARLYRSEQRTPKASEMFAEPATVEEDRALIVRRKRYAMKPMTPEEAIAEMEMLGHGFYLFMNSETEACGVVYRRIAGDYGLIEPEAL